VCLIRLIHITHLIQHNPALVYGILGTIEVLFLTTFVTLRSNFINDAKNAVMNAYSYHYSRGTYNFVIEEKWNRWARDLTGAATSRTYSLNFSIWSFLIFLLSLGLHISSGEMHWKVPCCPLLSLITLVLKSSLLIAASVFLIISIVLLILALANFAFNRNAKHKEFSNFLSRRPIKSDFNDILKYDKL
jgi:hypothetical protein